MNLVANTVSQVVAGLGCHYSEQDNGWLTQLLAKIGEHEGLMAALVTFVWKQILTEVSLSFTFWPGRAYTQLAQVYLGQPTNPPLNL